MGNKDESLRRLDILDVEDDSSHVICSSPLFTVPFSTLDLFEPPRLDKRRVFLIPLPDVREGNATHNTASPLPGIPLLDETETMNEAEDSQELANEGDIQPSPPSAVTSSLLWSVFEPPANPILSESIDIQSSPAAADDPSLRSPQALVHIMSDIWGQALPTRIHSTAPPALFSAQTKEWNRK